MKHIFLSIAFFASALSQTFEPTDFNLTEALLANGVDISFIPQLSGLAERSSAVACSIACNSLGLIFGSKIVVHNSSEYDAFTNSYWSVQQASVNPHCIFKPEKALDVSTLVLLARLTQCPFAAKSGGHAAFQGASSIEGGITVTFENMKGLKLSKDKKVATVEPGNVWHDVYSGLEKDGVAVIGGRVAPIGVGGLTLGGGISFFANMHGWACDNVLSYEVVTASGRIINVSASSYPDLYWALKGGGNNFGLVTKFNLKTFPLGLMWGGDRLYLEDQFEPTIDAFINLGKNSAQDPKATQILSFVASEGQKVAYAQLEYAEPNTNASIFEEWNAIPPYANSVGIHTLSELTEMIAATSPKGFRESYWVQTYKLDKGMLKFILDVFYDELPAIADATDLLPAISFQVITVPQIEKMQQNGGNALGLSADEGPLILINISSMWSDVADDSRIMQFNSNIIKRTKQESETRGLASKYLYMNYASLYQDVVASYGATNKARLQAIAAKYDPSGVFERLHPGYFKLDGPPNPDMP